MKLSRKKFTTIALLLLDFADDFRQVKDQQMQFVIYDFYISKIVDVIEGKEIHVKHNKL